MKLNASQWAAFSILTAAFIASLSACSSKSSSPSQAGSANPGENTQTATVAALAPAPIPPKFDLVAKNTDGTVDLMDEDAAAKYCSAKNMRLPTIRELALLATSEGATGISPSDTNQPDLTHVQVMDANKKVTDDFYYDASGYLPTTPQDIQDEWLWSSSITQEKDGSYGYYFSVSMGFISGDLLTATHAVRCVMFPITIRF